MKKSLQDIVAYYIERFGFESDHLNSTPDKETKMIIVIPVYNEPAITETLDSLLACTIPDSPVEVILVVNNSRDAVEDVKTQNLNTIDSINSWSRDNVSDHLTIQVMTEMQIPAKHAGVGLARKIGMDEACRRFASINYNGLIVCLDADCTVEENYLFELEGSFANKEFVAGNIYYEHSRDSEKGIEATGIVKYELGLRYYVNALRYAGYPYAYHTIGSSMAVSAKTYALAGGMNKRKAGEDFYFLHKLIPLGAFQELNSTCVYPSGRISDRVPFGTGRAMLKWKEQLQQGEEEIKTYNFQTFRDLKLFIDCIPILRNCTDERRYNEQIAHLPSSIGSYLNDNKFYPVLSDCIAQSSSESTFLKRIYAWLDGFQVLKFVHYSRDRHHANQSVNRCAKDLLEELNERSTGTSEPLLKQFRELDRSTREVSS